jgi:ABC-2 type transport system permease protein
MLAQDALNEVAGTGTARYRHFVSLVDEYRREWRAFFVPLVLKKARVTDHETIPRFRFREEPLRYTVARASIFAGAVAIAATLLATFGVARLRRFPLIE